MNNLDPAMILAGILPIVLAITVHEAAHAYAARHYGDHTAEQLGRLTLNPLAHIDWVGTVFVPLFLLLTSGLIFGWAKPVPIQTRYFRNIRVGMRMVALAGPLSNLAMFVLWAVIMRITGWLPPYLASPLTAMAQVGISINAVLFALNILPIPPLDGSRVVDSFLPAKASMAYRRLEPYGMIIVVLLVISNVLSVILSPVLMILSRVAQYIVGFYG